MIRNRAVLNAIRDAVFLADADTGMIVDANRAAESLCGRSLTELQSLHHTELHTPALAEAARGSFENNAQAPGLTEGIIQHKDGRRIPVEASSSSFTAPYGRRMLIGVFRDISERLAAREALRRNERIYRAIGESIDYGVWVCAPDGRNTYASESFLKLVGQTQEQCSSFGWGDVLHPDDAERTIASWKECVRTEGRWDVEHRFRGADGEWHPILARGVPVRDERGAIRCWAGINLDISRLKRTEECLRTSEAQARAQAAEMRAIMGTVPAAILIANGADCREITGSLKAYQLLRRPPGSNLSMSAPSGERPTNFRVMRDGAEIPPEEMPVQKAAFTGQAVRDAEVQLRFEDGGSIDLLVNVEPLFDGNGRPAGAGGVLSDITERKQTEMRLLQIQAAVESASDAIGMSDAQGRHFFQNKAFTEMFGYASAEEYQAAGGGPAGFCDPAVAKELFDTIQSGGSWRGELKLATKDGRVFDGFNRADAVKDKAGNVVGLMGVITDITEQKRAHELLRQSEERFRGLFENATVGIYRTTPTGRIEIANPALVRMLGYESFEALAERNLEEGSFEPAYPRADFRKILEDEGEIQGLEAVWTRRDGSSLFARESARCVRNETGAVLCYEGIVEEITERKRAEEALRSSEEKFAAAFRLGPAAMSIIDIENGNRMIDVNERFEQASGYSRDELLGHTGLGLGLWTEPDEYSNAVSRFRTEGELRDFEFHFRTKSGDIRIGLLSAEPMEINHRRCVITCTLDITERRQAEADRERLREQLAQAQRLESIGRLAGGIAHDFNNLMGVVTLYADSALEELSAGDSAVGSVTAIQETTERAVALGRQLMAFSSKQLLRLEVLNLNSVIADSQKLVRRLIGEDIDVVFRPGSDLDPVRADRGQLGQILMNLAVNSRDAMPEGGTFAIETANIELDPASAQLKPDATPGSYVLLAVKDTGIGMNQDTQAQVFEPFFTTKEIGKGTGLGLSVVYGIVKQSGGFINVASELGRGAEFKIYLPAAREAAEPVPGGEEAATVGGSETILIVEDEPALRDKIQEILRNAGYQVLAAPDGHQAFQLSLRDARTIHLLLTDVVMPGISGPRLSERVRSLHPHTRVLYMSGYPNADRGTVDLQSQPNFIQKPFTKAELLRYVRHALDGNTARIE